MTPRRQRLLLAAFALAALTIAGALVVSAFRKNLVFFYTPSQVAAGEAPPGRGFRIGGLVEAGSLRRGGADGIEHEFIVTDERDRVRVRYRGLLPDLFKEGRGVVAQGRLASAASLAAGALFVADEVLAKHDENYMAPEAAAALELARERSREGGR